MKKNTMLLLSLLLILKLSNAQVTHTKNTADNAARVSTSGNNINVVYHKIFWRLNPDTLVTSTTRPYVRGKITTYFTTTEDNVSSISFDLSKTSYQTGLVATHNGTNATTSFPTSGNQDLLTINLNSTIALAGTLDSVTITYRGLAPSVSGEAYGLLRSGSSTNNQNSGYYYWTLAESYEDKNFFPCKQDNADKIDSMQITISCPTAHTAVSNGKLISTVTTPIGREFTFKTNYPIASYLVAFSVGRFNKYTRTPVNISGTSVPITYYRRANMTSTQLAAADVNRTLMTGFSNLIGDYPFKNDGYGMMEFGFGGGMEHQTMSSMSSSAFTGFGIIAHELAHQWFGNKVTFTDWNDLWIAEGYAKYFESVAAEIDGNSSTDPIAVRNSIKSAALSATAAPITILDITSSNTIWTSANNSSVYNRGAMVVSMLRKQMGNTNFYNASQNFLNSPNHAYKSINTNELKAFYETESSLNLNEFFSDWIYGKGNPIYAVKWANNGNNIGITLNQTVSANATVTNFSTPVPIRITNSTGGDTTVVIFDENNSNATTPLIFNLSFTPTAVTLDPYHDALITRVGAGSTVAYDNTIIIQPKIAYQPTKKIEPIEYVRVLGNPILNNDLQVVLNESTTNKGALIHVVDMNGKIITFKKLTGTNVVQLNLGEIKAGNYIVAISNAEGTLIATTIFTKK
jgi:aminopeptidase N